MASTKLSSKYQIVVPKAVRAKLKLKAGMTVTMYAVDDDHAIIMKRPVSYTKSLLGLGKEVWQSLGGTEKYIQRERASWIK